jgi:hypothetical protein
MKLLSVLLLGAGLALVQQPAEPGPPVPYEDEGACPFEGCVYRTWTANRAVAVRTERRSDAPIAFLLAKGARVQALTGVVVTHTAGRVEFPKPVELRTELGLLRIQPGETLYLLTYKGEGYTKAWFKGRFYDDMDASGIVNAACDVVPERCIGKIVERSLTTWWVQIENSRGRVGWSNEPESFDGKNDD